MGKKKGKGAKGGKDAKKGKKGKKGKNDAVVAAAAPVEAVAAAPPPTVETNQCADQLKPADPCKYTDDPCCKVPMACKPNHYPGMLDRPETMAVVGSQCGGYGSLCKLLNAGFRCASRVFAMVPWGNYVVIRSTDGDKIVYFLYDGCSCNVNKFRYLDLCCGTAGFLFFENMHDVINYILASRDVHRKFGSIRKSVVDDICKEYCEYGSKEGGGGGGCGSKYVC